MFDKFGVGCLIVYNDSLYTVFVSKSEYFLIDLSKNKVLEKSYALSGMKNILEYLYAKPIDILSKDEFEISVNNTK